MMTEILILGELDGNELHSSAGELIAAGRKLADELGMKVSAAIIGEAPIEIANEAISIGADQVYTVSHELIAQGVSDTYVAALEFICNKVNPAVVLTAKTPIGRSAGPRLAYRLGTGVAQDCINLEGDAGTGKMTVTRPVYGGNAMAKFTFANNETQVAVLRIKAFEPLPTDADRSGLITHIDLEMNENHVKSKLVETVKEQSEGVKLEDAEVIIGGGRGLGGPEPFSQLEELAKLFDSGAVGASRAVCDAGWLDHSYQIGLTGKTVTPNLYITFGISGASQHMAGCSASKNIVAINKDGEANIFKEASFGVIGDWEKVLPSFTATVQELLST